MQKTIDLRGLTCPEPVLRTKKLLDDISVERVEALVDDEINVNNLQRLARSLKLKMTAESKSNFFRVIIEREDQNTSGIATRESSSRDEKGLSTVVLLNKETFGEGEKDFSSSLLNLFLQTLFDSLYLPRAILLANSGVKLMAPGASTLKVLDDFQKSGCEVLACGLCLEFYGLKDKVPKEQITNMFAICEYLIAADKVLMP
jgi:selenium metabolism protein YedF